MRARLTLSSQEAEEAFEDKGFGTFDCPVAWGLWSLVKQEKYLVYLYYIKLYYLIFSYGTWGER